MSAAMTTEWELKLKDYASGAFKKLQEYATGSQKKLNGVNDELKKHAANSINAGRDFKRSYGQLEDTLKAVEERQKAAFNIKHIQAYQSVINKTKHEMEKLNAVMNKPTNTSFFSMFNKTNRSALAQEIPMLNRALIMASSKAVMIGALVVGVGAGMEKSLELAVNYETGMAKINATAQLSTDSLGTLKNRLIEIGSNSGGNFERIPEAYEKILSQTNKVNLSLDILEVSVKGAKAGFTDIDTVAGALARTLSVVGEKNTTANAVLDTLFKAKQLGAGEFSDFAQFLPQLIASGKNLSISFKDTAGMFAYMTAKGQSATDTAMLMENAFTALQKKQVIEGMSKKGLSLFNKDGSRKNIKDVFVQLSGVMDKMTDFQKTKFLIDIGMHDAQARNAFSVLTSDADKFKKTMDGVNNALGETDRQLAATANHARTWGDITDKIKGWAVALGDILIPVVDVLTTVVEGFGVGIRELATLGLWDRGILSDKQNLDIQNYEKKVANDAAVKNTQLKFGDKINWGKGTETNAFFDKEYKRILGLMPNSGGKNNIDKNESAAEAALANVNKGKSLNGDDGSKTTDMNSITTDSGKIRTLIMNLQIHNNFKGEESTNISKIKQMISDGIVDAARDSMVTIGV